MLISTNAFVSNSQVCVASTAGVRICIYRAHTAELAVALLIISADHHLHHWNRKRIKWPKQTTRRLSALNRVESTRSLKTTLNQCHKTPSRSLRIVVEQSRTNVRTVPSAQKLYRQTQNPIQRTKQGPDAIFKSAVKKGWQEPQEKGSRGTSRWNFWLMNVSKR